MVALAIPPSDPVAIYGRCASCAAVHRAPAHLRTAALGTQTRHLPTCIGSHSAAANRAPRRQRSNPRGTACTRPGCTNWAIAIGPKGSELSAVCYYCHAQDLGAPRVRRGGAS